MRTERMRREGRGTSSAGPPPLQEPGQPRMGLHQVGDALSGGSRPDIMPCKGQCLVFCPFRGSTSLGHKCCSKDAKQPCGFFDVFQHLWLY